MAFAPSLKDGVRVDIPRPQERKTATMPQQLALAPEAARNASTVAAVQVRGRLLGQFAR